MKPFSFLFFFSLFGSILAEFEIFFSQRDIVNPCTGSSIFFDFGKLSVSPQFSANIFSGNIQLWSTLRQEGDIWEDNSNGDFSISVPGVPGNVSNWKTGIRFDS